MVAKRSLAFQMFAFLSFIAVAVVVLYIFSQHIVIFNLCPANTSLVVNGSKIVCYTDFAHSVIVKGQAYTLNSSLAVDDGQVALLDFKFLDLQPLFEIWNQNSTESAGSYIFLTIPDTFKVHMAYKSSVPTEFIVMSNQEYVSFASTGTVKGVLTETGTDISVWFNDSAGCAGYVGVIKAVSGSAYSIQPNETALYSPAQNATGICA